jgi:outer membrane protease
MVVVSHYEEEGVGRFNRIAIYKLHSRYNPDLMIWPMSGHDPQRTNNATFKRTTWVDHFRSQQTPERFTLDQNYPNPFNSSTTIRYSVKASYPVQVRLKVFNIFGQEVRSLVDNVRSTGSYFVTWNGRSSRGEEVASGIYIYRLTVGAGSTSERKMVLLR